MRRAPGCSWNTGYATAKELSERPSAWYGLEALYAPALGPVSLNPAASTLRDYVRHRDAIAIGTPSAARGVLGPAISLLGSGARFVANNTADKFNFVHQTARFSIVVVMRLSIVGLTQTIVDNTLSQTANTGFSLSIDSSGRPVLLITRGVNGSPAATVIALSSLAGNTFYVVTATGDGTTAKLFVDGLETGSATVGSLGASNASFRLNLGGQDDGATSMRGHLLMVGLWSRCLASSELRRLSGDPFALLRQQYGPALPGARGTKWWGVQSGSAYLAGCQSGLGHRAGAVAGRVIH